MNTYWLMQKCCIGKSWRSKSRNPELKELSSVFKSLTTIRDGSWTLATRECDTAKDTAKSYRAHHIITNKIYSNRSSVGIQRRATRNVEKS